MLRGISVVAVLALWQVVGSNINPIFLSSVPSLRIASVAISVTSLDVKVARILEQHHASGSGVGRRRPTRGRCG